MVNLPLSALIAAGLLVLVCGYVWGLSAVYYIWYDFVRVKIMKKPSHAMQPDELIWILLGFASGWLGLGLIILGIVIRVAGSDKWVWWLPLVVMGAACFYPYFEWPWKRYGDLMVIGAACWLGLWGKFTFDWYGPMDPFEHSPLAQHPLVMYPYQLNVPSTKRQ